MAQRLPKQLCPGTLLTAIAAIYATAPDNALTTISAATVTNDTASARTVTFHIVPAGGVPSSANKVLAARVIAAGESYNVMPLIGHTLPAGATVQALADVAASVALTMSGYVTNP